jgi:hypothetical protein
MANDSKHLSVDEEQVSEDNRGFENTSKALTDKLMNIQSIKSPGLVPNIYMPKGNNIRREGSSDVDLSLSVNDINIKVTI